jgi:hypothetical protein
MPYFLAKASQAVTCLCHLVSAALLPALPRFPVGGGGCGCGGGAVGCAGAGCGVGWGGRRFLVPPTSSPLPLCELSAALVRGLASLDPLPPGLLDLRPELGREERSVPVISARFYEKTRPNKFKPFS